MVDLKKLQKSYKKKNDATKEFVSLVREAFPVGTGVFCKLNERQKNPKLWGCR